MDKFQDKFQKLLAAAVEAGRTNELAGEFEVSPSTITRWASGHSVPHLLIASVIVLYLEAQS